MDTAFTEKMQEWLALDPAERDIEAGALLLLQLNRNKILYKNILRRPKQMASKLEYELKKHLRIRLDGKTLRDLYIMEREVIPAADKTLSEPAPATAAPAAKPPYRGKRADHDSLPEEIKAIYEKNGEIFHKLRQTRETLRTLENAMPCDRYEHCKILQELDTEYRRNWERYDSWKA